MADAWRRWAVCGCVWLSGGWTGVQGDGVAEFGAGREQSTLRGWPTRRAKHLPAAAPAEKKPDRLVQPGHKFSGENRRWQGPRPNQIAGSIVTTHQRPVRINAPLAVPDHAWVKGYLVHHCYI